jgi:uncharacterized membrane protein
MKTPNQQKKDYKGAVIGSWVMISLTCLVALIPGVGFLTWFIGVPILLITFILGIIVLSKGGTMQGVVILLMSLIVAPIFLMVAPILTTSLFIGAGADTGANVESEVLDSDLDLEAQEALPGTNDRKAEQDGT